jgi:hypothetical protein
MWAAHWLASGHDGLALAELASLNGRDPVEVREALPDALRDIGIHIPDEDEAAAKVALDELARMHLDPRANWRWLVQQVDALVIETHFSEAVLRQPLGALWAYAEAIGQNWGPSNDEIAAETQRLCREQLAA